MDLRQEVLDRCRRMGADMAGIAPVERFRNAPLRMSPSGLLPSAKSVIVAGIHHPDACVELGGEPSPHDMGPYMVQGTMNAMLDDISFAVARLLEDRGYPAIPVAASNIWRYGGYKDLKVDFAPDIAHRYAAVAAGLGEIGWSGLFLTYEYGPRQRVVSVVTEAEIEPDRMHEGPPACDRCMECVKKCPVDAFRTEVRGMNRVEIGGKVFEFPDTNKWRCSWAENFSLSLDHLIPAKVDEAVCLEYLEKYGQRGGEEGCCLKYCMSAGKRYYPGLYSAAPGRKKSPVPGDADLFGAIVEICAENCVDILAAGPEDLFKDDSAVHPGYHLPDAATVISLGMRAGEEHLENEDMRTTLERRLKYASFKTAHYLDSKGYSAVCGTNISDNGSAGVLGVRERGFVYSTVLTNAGLKGERRFRALPDSPPDKSKKDLRGLVSKVCLEAGCDMEGVFNVARFNGFFGNGKNDFPGRAGWVVEDAGLIYGRFFPEIKQAGRRMKTPEDWLPGAKSVIVIGVGFPDAPVDFAKTTPAETVGPFAFVCYESLYLARDAAFRITRELERMGARAVFTADITGTASKRASSRGRLPDLRAGMPEAFLAGLAYPGLSGHPLTGERGPRQRFAAVITDLDIPGDPPYGGAYACGECSKPCISACPVSALKEPAGVYELEGKAFPAPRVDCFACDWAKMYCMSGEEGGRYCGLGVDEPVPAERSPETVSRELSRVDWGMQKRHVNVAEECVRVCPAGKKSTR